MSAVAPEAPITGYVVEHEAAQAIHEYLTSRPYAEVFHLIRALQASPAFHGETAPVDELAERRARRLIDGKISDADPGDETDA